MPASFDYTVELERALLKILTSNSFVARSHMCQIREEWFTSTERRFIVAVAHREFRDHRIALTKTIFEYQVNSQLPDKDRPFFIGEWNLIENFVSSDTVETLIAKLKDAQIGREVLAMNGNILELLNKGDIRGAVQSAKRGAVRLGTEHDPEPIVEVTDYDRRKAIMLDKQANPEKYAALRTGFPELDNRTGGLYKGELTLIAGLTGVGKSTLCKQIEMNVVRLNHGKNVLHIANEEYMEQVEHKFDATISHVPYRDFKRGTISQNNMEHWEAEMNRWKKYGRIFIKSIPAFSDVTLVEQAFQELADKGIKIDLIVIDHLPHIMPIQKIWNENDERAKAAADCKELARSLHVPVITPTQAATIVEEKQAKNKATGKMDVYGSKGQVHIANTFILITETGKDPTQTGVDDADRDVLWKVEIKKNRDGPPFFFTVKHSVHYGKIEEVHVLDNKGTKIIPTAGQGAAAALSSASTISVVETILDEAIALKETKSPPQQSPNSPEKAPASPVEALVSAPTMSASPLPVEPAIGDHGDAYEGDLPAESAQDFTFPVVSVEIPSEVKEDEIEKTEETPAQGEPFQVVVVPVPESQESIETPLSVPLITQRETLVEKLRKKRLELGIE